MKLTENEKLKMLNNIEVVESSISNGECEYILIDNNEDNRGVLNDLGITNEELEEWTDEEYIDISEIGFKLANWYSTKDGFYNIDNNEQY